jgi:hypothetical protein
MESFDLPLTRDEQGASIDALDVLLGSYGPEETALLQARYAEDGPQRQAMQALLNRLVALRYPSDGSPVVALEPLEGIESRNFILTPDEARDWFNALDMTRRQYDAGEAAGMRAIYADGTPDRDRLTRLLVRIITLQLPSTGPVD